MQTHSAKQNPLLQWVT